MRYPLTVLLLAVALGACDRDERPKPEPPDTAAVDTTAPDTGQAPTLDTVAVDSLRASGMQDTSGPPMLRAARAAVLTHPDTSFYTIYHSLSRPPRPGDTVQIRLGRDSSAAASRFVTSRKKTAQKDTTTLGIPKVHGQRVRQYACVRLSFNGVNQPALEKCANWYQSLPAKVDTTPPVVDTVRVDSALAIRAIDLKPDNAGPLYQNWRAPHSRTKPGLADAQQQFCPFFVFGDGQVALREKDQGNPVCIAEYAKFPATKTRPSAAQQLIANGQCVTYQVSGGTIVQETCPDTTVRTTPRTRAS